MALAQIVFPRTEDKHTSSSDSIKEIVRWFVIVTETIIGQKNEGMLLSEEDILHCFLFW